MLANVQPPMRSAEFKLLSEMSGYAVFTQCGVLLVTDIIEPAVLAAASDRAKPRVSEEAPGNSTYISAYALCLKNLLT